MQFISRLMKWFKPLGIEDAFFGHLAYMEVSHGASYWEAKRPFGPISAYVEAFIDAPGPRLPPNEEQRAFFGWVEQNYPAILANVERALPSLLEQLTKRPLIAPFTSILSTPFSDTFRLTSLSIPVPHDGVVPKWEISFESNAGEALLLTVQMIGTDPQPDISFDFC